MAAHVFSKCSTYGQYITKHMSGTGGNFNFLTSIVVIIWGGADFFVIFQSFRSVGNLGISIQPDAPHPRIMEIGIP